MRADGSCESHERSHKEVVFLGHASLGAHACLVNRVVASISRKWKWFGRRGKHCCERRRGHAD